MHIEHSSELLIPAFVFVEQHRRTRLRQVLTWLFITGILLLALLAGCTGVMDVKAGPPLSSAGKWILLPFGDYGETPQAGERAEELASALVRVRWNIDLQRYPVTKESADLVDLDERQRYDKALEWARGHGYELGLGGSVQEWRYRSGGDGEAGVGLSLRVIDIKTGSPLWLATGARSGFGAQTVSGVAEQLLRDMVEKITVK